MSPGSYCKVYADRVEKKRLRLSAKSQTREYKKKRREQKETRSSKVRQLENREGVQYESGLGWNESVETAKDIPPPIVRPEIKQICPQTSLKKVVIDLETSSRGIFIFLLTKEKNEL